ncbi:hypothetical protein IWW50_001698 [Coemansia erecta]|nr:hypothetical protein GGF43_001744 [Coemansia sp. RSA 2618]KAJ2827828.1 hypothetical protein IWW50_001698 [Coemansia erecta]
MNFNSSLSIDSHGPSHLGLWSPVEPAYTLERQPRSLSVRTAAGQRVSILNDDSPIDCSVSDSDSDTDSINSRRYAHSVGSCRYAHSDSEPRPLTPLLPSPQLSPIRLPSLSVLVEAVKISNSSNMPMLPPPCSQSYPQSHCLHLHQASAPAYSQAVAHTRGKRKYHCSYPSCGKAFTTSGHLSRHFRIHTGEKNYHCMFPGCTSRFSRQDNMMQHYRTHLSPRSRRNRTMRAATTSGYSSVLAGYPNDVATPAFNPYNRTVVQYSPIAPSQGSFL